MLSLIKSAALLPFSIFYTAVVSPIVTFCEVLKYGLIIIPLRFLYKVVYSIVLPFTFMKPAMKIEFNAWNLFTELSILYRFFASCIIFGCVIGLYMGGTWCLISYLLKFDKATIDVPNPYYVLKDKLLGPKKEKFGKLPYGRGSEEMESFDNLIKVKLEQDSGITDSSMDSSSILKNKTGHGTGTDANTILEESLYEDDDGYHLTREDTESSTSTIMTNNKNNNMSGFTTTATTISEEDDQKLRYRGNARYNGVDTETESELETEEDEEQEEQFFDSRRQIHTIEEED